MVVMERHQRDFKGVWIEAEIWMDRRLSYLQKGLFTEIRSLDREEGCWASNRYFAEFFGIHERKIREHIAKLKSLGLIIVTVKNRNDRVIRVIGKYARMPESKRKALEQMRTDLGKKFRYRG